MFSAFDVLIEMFGALTAQVSTIGGANPRTSVVQSLDCVPQGFPSGPQISVGTCSNRM